MACLLTMIVDTTSLYTTDSKALGQGNKYLHCLICVCAFNLNVKSVSNIIDSDWAPDINSKNAWSDLLTAPTTSMEILITEVALDADRHHDSLWDLDYCFIHQQFWGHCHPNPSPLLPSK